ncbi:CPBP family intramembrane glutamic endopeptidase [Heyndrickxia acidicola]|uniref:Type II CAAX endopeptidase family protein n=1 Tax=Heyndrickxia acidicola TaxID=209389 RepID=A0ABU6MM97_9BACI|nr:type II CAAX endopeptidase family protein [Heyndrickxia acidicola]MED1205811.1 type II CAAX endopeptidase family protein [Heyndrickxia acidicola]
MKKWFKNKDGKVRSGWKLLLAFALMNLFTSLLSIPVVIIYAFTNIHVLDNIDRFMADPGVDFFMMLAQLLGVIVTLAVCLKKEKRNWRDLGLTPLSKQGKNLLFGLFLGMISILLCAFFMVMTKQAVLVPAKITPSLIQGILLSFIGFIFVAANEELFFRGYVISVLKQTRSTPLIYLGSCLLFSLAHTENPHVHIMGIINICLIGLLFAYMFIQTKSLWMSMGYHFLWNFFQGNILGFDVSGTPGNGFFHIKEADNLLTGGSFGIEASVWTTLVIVMGFFITKLFLGKKNTINPAFDKHM